jgi:hypothetical protein
VRRLVVFSVLPVLLATFAVVHIQLGVLQKGGHRWLGILPVSRDASIDLYGWADVAQELRRRGIIGRTGTFLFTSKWYHSGQLAFALHNETPVLCYNPTDSHGFAYWSDPRHWVGQDGILLVVNHSSVEPAIYNRWFTRIEPLGEIDVLRAGSPVRKVWIYHCIYQKTAFPFDGSKASAIRAQMARKASFGDNRT